MTAAAPLYLVSCTKRKAAGPCPARELYAASDWFAKVRAWLEAIGADWLILSAEHGVVDPDQVLAPYETTLLTMSAAERLAWSAEVLEQLIARDLFVPVRPVVMLAGALYREHLEPAFTHGGLDPELCAVPMRGLGLGQQKAWLARAAAGARA